MTATDPTPQAERTTAPEVASGYPTPYPKAFWVALVIGWAIIAFGLRGLFANAHAAMNTDPKGWALLVVKANLAHDLVLLPLVFGIGILVARYVPQRVRAPVQAGLICSAIVTLFTYPFVRGFGRNPANPTILPQNYGRGLLVVLVFVWVVVAGWAAWRWHRSATR